MGKDNTIIYAMVIGAAIAIIGTYIGYILTNKNQTTTATYIQPEIPYQPEIIQNKDTTEERSLPPAEFSSPITENSVNGEYKWYEKAPY